jgi:hypothetical protein
MKRHKGPIVAGIRVDAEPYRSFSIHARTWLLCKKAKPANQRHTHPIEAWRVCAAARACAGLRI